MGRDKAEFNEVAGMTRFNPALLAAETALEERARRMRDHFEQTGADVAERAAGEIQELRGLLSGQVQDEARRKREDAER